MAHPEVLDLTHDSMATGRTRVVVSEGRLRGFATISVRDDHLELEDLFVDPE